VLFAKEKRHIISKNVSYQESDHHQYPGQGHVPLYQNDTENNHNAEE